MTFRLGRKRWVGADNFNWVLDRNSRKSQKSLEKMKKELSEEDYEKSCKDYTKRGYYVTLQQLLTKARAEAEKKKDKRGVKHIDEIILKLEEANKELDNLLKENPVFNLENIIKYNKNHKIKRDSNNE